MAKVYVSAVLNGPTDMAWGFVRDFNGLPSWLPGIMSSEIEEGKLADEIGAVRVMEVGPGMTVREKLLALCDDPYSITYSVIEGPLPLSNLTATINVRPVTQGGATFVEWFAEFDPNPGSEEKAPKILTSVYTGGLTALGEKIGDT